MARRSASSSALKSNGHASTPEPADAVPLRIETSDDDSDSLVAQYKARLKPLPVDPSMLPGGRRSLSLIGLQAFFLGFTFAACLLSTAICAIQGRSIWRLFAFFACLGLFHFLEYWTTAQFNVPAVRASSFLLYSNGTAYNIAHTIATLEICFSCLSPAYQSFGVSAKTVTCGVVLVVVGQTVRSTAMAQAGTNFNHSLQRVRKDGHELVTTGIYGWLRHPSYFGFFYWALGTQLLVGNKVSFAGYVLALWSFFYRRIKAEEKILIGFFGERYETYRAKTITGIPFIR